MCKQREQGLQQKSKIFSKKILLQAWTFFRMNENPKTYAYVTEAPRILCTKMIVCKIYVDFLGTEIQLPSCIGT